MFFVLFFNLKCTFKKSHSPWSSAIQIILESKFCNNKLCRNKYLQTSKPTCNDANKCIHLCIFFWICADILFRSIKIKLP